MLHELLLSLVGYTGDFVIDESERREALGVTGPPIPPNSPTFRLASDLTFLQPSERSVIEGLLPLGYYYRELDRFATVSRNLSSIWSKPRGVPFRPPTPESFKPDDGVKPSMYRRAIANGIVEILSVYRSAVLLVEQKLLSDPDPILATVTQGLNKFFMLLPPLHDLVVEIERDDIRGGQLLSLLSKRCHCGVPELQVCFQRLLWHGHQTLYNQLVAWMVNGILHDPHGEFFIRREEKSDAKKEISHSGGSEKVILGSSNDASLTDWQLGFHVFLGMLPEYINIQIAESILFSGKAIRILRNPSASFGFPEAILHQPIEKGFYQAQEFLGGIPSLPEISLGTNLPGEKLLPQSEADKIDKMLQELKKSSEFHKRSFECTIDSVRVIAANHLWQLVVIRADLNGHLKALKDYFLLAKGDFFQCFLEESRQLMRLPPRPSTAEADLLIPFQLASLKTISDADKYFSRVSLRMLSFSPPPMDLPSEPMPSLECSPDGWDGFSLEYSVNWPLQLFFTQDVLSKYRKVFQYLIRLKRTQMELEKSWASVMHQGHSDFARRHNDHVDVISQLQRQRSPMWRVREHMAFLIRNLQFYIQRMLDILPESLLQDHMLNTVGVTQKYSVNNSHEVDVIESQWNVLQGHIQGSRDFTELVAFHQEYLSALISQSFLDIGSVSRILDSIMKLCLQFCLIIERHDNSSVSPELEHITEEFNKKSNSLYTILRSSRLAGSQRAPYLRRFLMRLNFNSFFESTARGVLNIFRPRAEGTIS